MSPRDIILKRFQHKKRKSTYLVGEVGQATSVLLEGSIGCVNRVGPWVTQVSVYKSDATEYTGEVQGTIEVGDWVVIYESEADGRIWLREYKEFMDGRFEALC